MPENPYEPPKEVGTAQPSPLFTWKEFAVRSTVAVLLIVAIEVVLLLVSVWVPALRQETLDRT